MGSSGGSEPNVPFAGYNSEERQFESATEETRLDSTFQVFNPESSVFRIFILISIGL